MKTQQQNDIQHIINKVAIDEKDIIGDSVVSILIANNFNEKTVNLTNDSGGYDLPSSEFIIEVVTLMISFATFGLELYDRIKDRGDMKSQIKSQEEKINELQEKIVSQKPDYNKLLIEKQLEICREIFNMKEKNIF